jgi:hypothetical protein
MLPVSRERAAVLALNETAYIGNDLRALRATFLTVFPTRLAAFLAFLTTDLALLAISHSYLRQHITD